MRHMADTILGQAKRLEFNDLCDWLIGLGLGCIEGDNGAVVIYPMASRHKNPAVVVVQPNHEEGLYDWTALSATEGFLCYVYQPDNYDLARGCEVSKVRTQAEDTALHS